MEIPAANAPAFKLIRPAEPDDHQLRVLVTAVDGDVIVDFGIPIQWARFTADQVENLIKDLQYAVRSAKMLYVPRSED